MSDRVTLQELQDVADPLVVTDDFTALANRAVKRLYAKAATPGDVELYHFGSDAYQPPEHTLGTPWVPGVDPVDEEQATSVFTFTENVSVFDLSLIQIGGDTALDLTATSSRDDENVINYSDSEFGSNCIQTINFHFTPSVAATALYEYINGLPSSNPDVGWTAQTANAFVTASIDGTSVTVTAIENGATGNGIFTRSSVSGGSWSSDETSGGVDEVEEVIEVPAVPTIGGVDYPEHMLALPAEYSHALQFKIVNGSSEEHDFRKVMSSDNHVIVPMQHLFQAGGRSSMAFVDYGWNAEDEVRMYAVPEGFWYKFDDGSLVSGDVYCLARRAYVPASSASDEFPFDNVDALKMAILATVYEDENDLERASTYWTMAMSELEAESLAFRGPQEINISYYDPASLDVVYTIN